MKRLSGIFLALFLGTAALAQERFSVDESLSFGYNRAYGLYEEESTMVGLGISDRLDARCGLKLMDGATAMELGAGYRIAGNFGAEGFATGQWNRKYGLQEYNIGLLGVWNWRGRVEVKAGTFFKWLSPLDGPGSVLEPFNFAYSLMFWALDTEKRFNLGASLSNLDAFTAERFYCPLVTVKARYSINRRYQVYALFRQHSSGTFDLTSNLFDRQFRIGTIIWW